MGRCHDHATDRFQRDFLDEARLRRDTAKTTEIERVAEHARLRRRARRGSFALGAIVATGVAVRDRRGGVRRRVDADSGHRRRRCEQLGRSRAGLAV